MKNLPPPQKNNNLIINIRGSIAPSTDVCGSHSNASAFIESFKEIDMLGKNSHATETFHMLYFIRKAI